MLSKIIADLNKMHYKERINENDCPKWAKIKPKQKQISYLYSFTLLVLSLVI